MFCFVTALAIALSVLEVWRTYLFKVVIDNYIMPKDYDGLLTISLVMISMLVCEVISTISFFYYASYLGQVVIKDIREKLFSYMIRFKMKYYDSSSVGVLVTRTVNDMERIGEIFSSGLFEIFSDFLKMMVVIAVMIYTDWRLALIVFATLPVTLYATGWFQRSMKVAFDKVRKEVANLNAFVQEHISGMKIVQLFAREKQESQRFREINEKHKKGWLATIWLNSIFFPLVDLITSVSIALIVWYGGFMSAKGSIQVGTMFMFIQLAQKMYRPLRQMADKFNTLQMGIIACGRVFDIIDTKDENLEEDASEEIDNVQGKIEFENVRFGYKPEEVILKNISFVVEKGEKVAIVGATGAGKSTIISLITRFYQIQGGKITIDGKDIRNLKLSWLRKHIGVVLQDVFLFADTIYKNITLEKENITLQEVEEAAKKIGIHEFFQKLPQGYNYNVKERGAMLSAGQRQLIAFLRTYVNKPEILILDEATSSVDSQSEQLIERAIQYITKERTSIIIAHRLATIQNADKIIVLDKGEIVECGTHTELIKKEGGHYRGLYKAAMEGQKI